MRVLIAAGGTGGHIYPGLAVAGEIMARDKGNEVRFVGTGKGLETQIVPENGYQLSLIDSAGLKNVGLVGKLKGLFVLPKSFVEARRLIKEFKPDVVVGAGGYVSGPVLMGAWMSRIPTLAMDSNALPGFTNRQLARFVTRAALTFEEALPYFGDKGVVTGNPVRKEFFDIEPKPRNDILELLLFGGSQGARGINFAMVDALDELADLKNSLSITHQTGKYDFEDIEKAYQEKGWGEANVTVYISDMVGQFGKTDLIVSRAGATTCAELAAAGKPAIMVPLPTAADDHQRNNAEALVAAGGAVMILQRDLTGKSLADAIRELAADPETIPKMGNAVKKLSKKDAAAATVDLIQSLINE